MHFLSRTEISFRAPGILAYATDVEAVTAQFISEEMRIHTTAKMSDKRSPRYHFYKDMLVNFHQDLTCPVESSVFVTTTSQGDVEVEETVSISYLPTSGSGFPSATVIMIWVGSFPYIPRRQGVRCNLAGLSLGRLLWSRQWAYRFIGSLVPVLRRSPQAHFKAHRIISTKRKISRIMS